jgi:valacyclovir hydrolase
MPKLQLDDFVVHFESVGEGAPLLLLPGALGTGTADFSDQISWFSQYFHVIAPDFRGYGQSRPPLRDYSVNFYQRDAEDMADLMSVMGFERFSILGWSDGANSGTLLAVRYPERVKQLVVWGGNSFLNAEDVHIFQSMRSLSTWSARAIEPLRSIYGEELQSLWEKYVAGIETLYAAGGELYRSELQNIQCPTLVLHGDMDPIVPIMHAEMIHQGIAGSELYRFAEGKHNIHKRYAAEFNQIVLSFLNRTKTD